VLLNTYSVVILDSKSHNLRVASLGVAFNPRASCLTL